MTVVLTQDNEYLGKAGDMVKVKRGYFRNYLYPKGIATRKDADVLREIDLAEQKKNAKASAIEQEAMSTKTKIEKDPKYIFEKKVRPGTDKIYGSLTATNVAEAIAARTGVAVRIASIDLPKVSELGSFSATVELLPEISAYIQLEVVAEKGAGADAKE